MSPYTNKVTSSTRRVETPGLELTAEQITRLYHYSDTCRLPWILQTGELRPGANKAGGFPDPEFVWATVNSLGDLTASVARGDEYMSGKAHHVRFTVAASDFFPWSEVTTRYPQWTPAHVERLRIKTLGRSDPKTWWCCPRPIKIKDCLAIETKSFRNKNWLALDPAIKPVDAGDVGGVDWLGIEVAGARFISAKITAPDGRTGYMVR